VVGSGSIKGAVKHVRSDGGGLPLTHIGRQPTPARARFKPLLPYQSLDPVQSTSGAFRKHVVPHPPGAIGSIAAQEAGTRLRAQFLVAPAALAARPRQPRMEAAPRDTERPAQPPRRPDPPVLRDEGELHVDSFAK